MTGYLVSDTATTLAARIARMFGIDPIAQKEEFMRVYTAVKDELLRHEAKAGRAHGRANPS